MSKSKKESTPIVFDTNIPLTSDELECIAGALEIFINQMERGFLRVTKKGMTQATIDDLREVTAITKSAFKKVKEMIAVSTKLFEDEQTQRRN